MQRLPVHDQQIVRIVGLANLLAKMNEFGHLEADHAALESEYLQPLGITPDGALMSIDWKKAVVNDTYYQVFSVIG